MKGIGSYGLFKPDMKELTGNRGLAKGKNRTVPDKTQKAADYQMSDQAKQMDSEALKELQNKSGTLHIEKKQEVAEGIELSDAAKKLLEELKDKYKDIDFFVAEFANDEEAQVYHRQSTKAYSCVIDPKTLEEMAADEAVKEKYVGIIDTADEKFDQMKEELGEDAAKITRMGINVDADGVATFFAEVSKTNRENLEAAKQQQKANRAAQKERNEAIEKKRKDKLEESEKLEEKKKLKKEEAAKRLERVEASSMEDLIKKVKEVLAGDTKEEVSSVKSESPKFDITL